ncbi:hypothetical protein K1719_018949 [Acacia pycnantha]|nr:hypothetical protein K1719_018949 [Acacia pycnantha]
MGNATKRMIQIAVNKAKCVLFNYECSPPVSAHTKAHLTLNSFEKGGPSECDNKYHSDEKPVVGGTSTRAGASTTSPSLPMAGAYVVAAMVVDECDSTRGCNEDHHDFQPSCDNNIVDASKVVWEALAVPRNQWGWYDITWSDA